MSKPSGSERKRMTLFKSKRFSQHDVSTCDYCLEVITFTTSTVDHIKPWSSVNNQRIDNNYALSCKKCNHDLGCIYEYEIKSFLYDYDEDHYYLDKIQPKIDALQERLRSNQIPKINLEKHLHKLRKYGIIRAEQIQRKRENDNGTGY